MPRSISRRSFVASCPAVVLIPGIVGPVLASPESQPPAVDPSAVGFPTQEPDLVREMVGVAHGNVARVKELVTRHATLAKAAWDWGFGDWETALGAASHVGNREIAEHLLAHGAQPTIFSAAMLGQLEVVKAFLAAAPGIQRTKGPHGITLLKHAVGGGPRSQAVVDYLTNVEGADEKPVDRPLSAEDAAMLSGSYAFGPKSTDRIEINYVKGYLMFERVGGTPRGLLHLGAFAFSPAGADNVRIRFEESAAGWVVTVHDPGLVLTARKAMG